MLRERLTAQLLAGAPARDPVAVAERLLAVQAQDPRAFRLAVRARTDGLSAADVDRALTEDRSLVVSWLNRGTLHLVRREDHPWLHALTAPRMLGTVARRLGQEGVSDAQAERAVATIERSLADGPLTRAQLGERIAAEGVPTAGQALPHLIGLAVLRGLAVRGPVAGRVQTGGSRARAPDDARPAAADRDQAPGDARPPAADRDQAYVLVRDWLGEPGPVDRDAALAELARRYLAGHGPAGERDLARWSGLPLRDARAGLAAIADELEERDGGLVDLARRPPAAAAAPPRLLGAFDPLLLGWESREPFVGEHGGAVALNGIIRAVALLDGRAAATWTMPGGRVKLAPLRPIAPEDAAALEEEAADVRRFLAAA